MGIHLFLLIKYNIKTTGIINIDSGCVYSNRENLGTLTAFNPDTRELINIKNLDSNFNQNNISINN
jgi:hypothetical protein